MRQVDKEWLDWFATYWHLIHTQDIEVLKSVTLLLHFIQAYSHFMCDFQKIMVRGV